MVKISELKTKIESEFNKMFIHKAYIQYYYDSIHKESILKPIERIPLVIRIRKFQEAFILRKPDHYLHGKPVFVVIRGYPLSIETDFLQTLKESRIEIVHNVDIDKTIIKVQETLNYHKDSNLLLEMKDFSLKKTNKKSKNEVTSKDDYNNGKVIIKTNILEKRNIEKNSSFELDTWLQTSYNQILLKKKAMDIQILALWIISIALTFVCTWLIADQYFESYYRERIKEANLIYPIINIIFRGLLLCRMIFFLI